MRRKDLPEPMRSIAKALDDWMWAQWGVSSSHHHAEEFVHILDELGYEVAPKSEPAPELDT